MWLAEGVPPSLLLTQGPDASVSGLFIIININYNFEELILPKGVTVYET
jgi:hypothetical protein